MNKNTPLTHICKVFAFVPLTVTIQHILVFNYFIWIIVITITDQ